MSLVNNNNQNLKIQNENKIENKIENKMKIKITQYDNNTKQIILKVFSENNDIIIVRIILP